MQKQNQTGLLFPQKYIIERCKTILKEMLFKESKGQI